MDVARMSGATHAQQSAPADMSGIFGHMHMVSTKHVSDIHVTSDCQHCSDDLGAHALPKRSDGQLRNLSKPLGWQKQQTTGACGADMLSARSDAALLYMQMLARVFPHH